ncbi:RxLR effector protein [Phytophthora megakarya]|uniref:RxLR effector protein n=1 Tax=Phytophthora megakarya TaxID=4795 RepID=A0A225WKU0_9STRA|nr:RxLR effector protein [Phytophthora megakarya]
MFLNTAIEMENFLVVPVLQYGDTTRYLGYEIGPSERFDIPAWAGTELRNLQKPFLWSHTTNTDPSRNKINPGLLYTARGAEGIGLVSIEVAVKAQRLKHALLWLIQADDVYFAAWRAWVFRASAERLNSVITPKATGQKQSIKPGAKLHVELETWLQPTQAERGLIDTARKELVGIGLHARSRRNENKLEICLYKPLFTSKSWRYEPTAC